MQRSSFFHFSLLLAVLLFTLANPCVAADFSVTRFDDPTPDGCSPTDCSLREAVIAANAASGADTIELLEGVYTLEIAGAAENASATGDLDVSDDLSIIGAGQEKTVIDADRLDRILEIFTNTTNFTLSDLTLRNGFVTTVGGGALLLNSSGTVNVSRCSITSSETTSFAGGGLANKLGGTLVISASIVSGNVSSNRGGGVANESSGTLTITDTTIENNLSNSSGGGVINQSSGSLSITDSTISNNIAGTGGGGVLNNGSGDTNISGSIVSKNISGITTPASGGGVLNAGSGEVTITMTRLTGNISADNAGGAGNDSTGTLTITDSLFDENVSSSNGGGVNNEAAGTVEITNSTFSGNISSGDGGAVHHEDTNAVTNLLNSTITLNTSRGTDAIYIHNGTDFTVTNTIIVDNFIGGDCSNSAGTLKDGGNNIFSTSGCMIFGGGTFPVGDPKLGPLADNGGPLPTHALLSGSEAIDAGNAMACPTTDARGFARPVDGDDDGTAVCDVGAIEKGLDCNSNGVGDTVDILNGTSTDCDSNDIPDECQSDSDSDGTIDACDECDSDPAKTEAGVCGCGVADNDSNENEVIDCLINPELHAIIGTTLSRVQALKKKSKNAEKKMLKANSAELKNFVEANADQITSSDPEANLQKLANKAARKVRRALKTKSRNFGSRKRQAVKALSALDSAAA